MEIKVTFKIKTRLSDADIKNSILNNENWSFAKEEDVNVWSPALYILGGCNVNDSNEPHTVCIDIYHDPDFQDFDELAAFIENKFDESEERVKKVSTELAAVKARFIEDTASADDIRARFKCPLCKCEYEAPISICEGYVTACGVGFKYHCPKCKAVRVTTDCYKKDKA